MNGKKWLGCFMFLMIVGTCAGGKNSIADENKTDIITTFYPMYIMTINVAKDVPGVSVSCMTEENAGCLHDYALTPRDMKNLEKGDILIANGAGMESFLGKISAEYPRMKVIELAHGIDLLRSADGKDNPHVWVSVEGAEKEVKRLRDALSELDPANAAAYRKNADEYILKLEKLRQKMHNELASSKGTKVLTFHEAFPYFAEEFGLKIAAVIEREPGVEPSARELAETIDLVRKEDVRILFVEPQYPIKTAQIISAETGAAVYVLDPCVTGPQEEDAYINTMEKNLKTLKEALKKQ